MEILAMFFCITHFPWTFRGLCKHMEGWLHVLWQLIFWPCCQWWLLGPPIHSPVHCLIRNWPQGSQILHLFYDHAPDMPVFFFPAVTKMVVPGEFKKKDLKIYIEGRLADTEGRKAAGRLKSQRLILHLFIDLLSKWLAHVGLEILKPVAKNLILVSHVGSKGTDSWTIFFCLPKCIKIFFS